MVAKLEYIDLFLPTVIWTILGQMIVGNKTTINLPSYSHHLDSREQTGHSPPVAGSDDGFRVLTPSPLSTYWRGDFHRTGSLPLSLYTKSDWLCNLVVTWLTVTNLCLLFFVSAQGDTLLPPLAPLVCPRPLFTPLLFQSIQHPLPLSLLPSLYLLVFPVWLSTHTSTPLSRGHCLHWALKALQPALWRFWSFFEEGQVRATLSWVTELQLWSFTGDYSSWVCCLLSLYSTHSKCRDCCI